jgi:hypothetical protein
MRAICKRLAFILGPYLLLAVVATVSVGLNLDLSAPPRFDGAGYAVLGEALASGRGYCEINKPMSPPHDHFPPGYPAALALLWRFTGRSVVVAHLFSSVCTVTTVLLAFGWLRTIYPPRSALTLGLALALNWSWGRVGGSIQSEPIFMLWEFLAILATVHSSRHNSDHNTGAGIALGVALAACILVRHVGLCVAAAAIVDLGLRGRWKVLVPASLTTVVLVLPWVIWLVRVHHHTQIGLLTHEGLAARITTQAFFYVQRLPDQITGPFVEVATVLRGSWVIATAANLWAVMVTGIMIWGWVRTLRTPRRRLAGIMAITMLALLLVWPFTEAGRFLIPLVPFLLVGLTEGLASGIYWARVRRPRQWAVVMVMVISVPYAAYAVLNGRAQAQRLSHADFDAACQWIARQTVRPGPVLTRHPGEAFWQTDRPTVEPDSADPTEIDGLISRLGIVYLLIDENRYVNAASNPLAQYVEQYPDRVALVWSGSHGTGSIRVFETQRMK